MENSQSLQKLFKCHHKTLVKKWWKVSTTEIFARLGLKISVFPRIVSAETILFWIYPYVMSFGHSIYRCGNYSRVETICGNTLCETAYCTRILSEILTQTLILDGFEIHRKIFRLSSGFLSEFRRHMHFWQNSNRKSFETVTSVSHFLSL